MLTVTGAQGSGKTTFADSWSQTADPKVTPHFKLPRDDEGLAILAENARTLVFNNLSQIPQWMSDSLCELADGSGMVLRSLYTNRDTTVFLGSNAVCLVSIGDVALAPDLLDRSLSVSLPERSEYIEPEQVEAAFLVLRPRLLGALLYCASRALRDSAKAKAPKGVRMAGAARWALAAAPAAGFTAEEISAAFTGAIKEADAKLAEQPLVAALVEVVQPLATWRGTTDDLRAELTEAHLAKVPETGTPTKKLPKDWPLSAQALRSELRKLAKTLTRSGFSFVWPTKGGRGGRLLTIIRSAAEGTEGYPTAEPSASGMATEPHVGAPDEESPVTQTVPADLAGSPPFGTMPERSGTMPSSEASHRSLDETRGRNDGNDGNDAFLILEEEKKEKGGRKGEEEQGHSLSESIREIARNIVPIVPIVPASGKQAGTMAPDPTVRSFPDRSATRTLRAKVLSGLLEPWPPQHSGGLEPRRERLVMTLALEDGTRAYSVHYAHPIWPDRVWEPLRSFGWDGRREADGTPVLELFDLDVTVEPQFQLGYGVLPTVTTVTVVQEEPPSTTTRSTFVWGWAEYHRAAADDASDSDQQEVA